ncbi:hypothetical protein GCM10020229_26340 [Kitasatospora albolonga]|uniref:hypothetical protein n=1 Tax=Kitasatospora albolonga TaxID=68173 RepID=UPI0031EB5608
MEKERHMPTDGELADSGGDFLDEFLSEEEEALLDERDRIDSRPGDDPAPPPGLSRFLIELDGSAEEYAARLRAVLGAALDRSVLEGRIDSQVVPRPVPAWFTAACAGDGPVPDFARAGASHYTEAGHGNGWSLDNWLWRFELDCPFRTWSWWDVTHTAPGTLSLWLDAHGEDAFAADDLRWAAYTAGARTVTGPTHHRLPAWRAEPSAGVVG